MKELKEWFISQGVDERDIRITDEHKVIGFFCYKKNV